MNYIPECYKKSILVFGCGNILFGDDGFGPAVAEYLQKNYEIPDDVYIMDVGTGVRNILFNLILSERKPEKIIIVDAVDHGKLPGEIFEISIEDLPEKKIDDFSLHEAPTSNLLKELRDFCGVDITIFACQVENLPEEVKPGLSKSLQEAIPKICKTIMESL